MFAGHANLVSRACDPREGTRGSGIICFREESDWPLKWKRSSILARIPGFRQRINPEPRVPPRGSQSRGTRLAIWCVYAPKLGLSGYRARTDHVRIFMVKYCTDFLIKASPNNAVFSSARGDLPQALVAQSFLGGPIHWGEGHSYFSENIFLFFGLCHIDI